MNRTDPPRDRHPVALWHQVPDGPARATALTEQTRDLLHHALAKLIARHILADPDAQVVIDHVVYLARDLPGGILPGDQAPLAPHPDDLEDDDEQMPKVADPATGTVRVMRRRCETCIYRRETRRTLGPSVPALIAEARVRDGFVVCHESLASWQVEGVLILPAICHGYANQYPDTYALRIARALGRVEPIDPPTR